MQVTNRAQLHQELDKAIDQINGGTGLIHVVPLVLDTLELTSALIIGVGPFMLSVLAGLAVTDDFVKENDRLARLLTKQANAPKGAFPGGLAVGMKSIGN